ncbi:hypothetical protein C1645_811578 [Glomus cerebriforme]|uniref:Uncharacterized protein n=1 Tax=Glomus cerebriforme TaxID=658196 RepID=A0A397TPH5_9GLOM|nr:hypothetical protein C1645_811578 [Glomus cerebriforme]
MQTGHFSVFVKLKILIHYSKSITSSSERLKKIIYDEYLEVFKKCHNQDLLLCLKIKVKYVKENWKENFHVKYIKKEKLNLFRDYMLEILKVNNLKTDYELLNDDLDIILSEDDYKIIEQNHQKTSNRIEKKKTDNQKQFNQSAWRRLILGQKGLVLHLITELKKIILGPKVLTKGRI